MKKKITEQEYLMLEGLMHLARFHNEKMNEYWQAMNDLMDDDKDEISAYVFDKHPVSKILEWREVEVVE